MFLQDGVVNMDPFIYMEALHRCSQDRPSWLLHDQRPAHRSLLVTMWLQHVKSWGVLLTPSHSPDLNPVEAVWRWIKGQLKHSHLTSMDNLKQEVMRLWEMKTKQHMVVALATSMSQRLQSVIDVGGDYTGW